MMSSSSSILFSSFVSEFSSFFCFNFNSFSLRIFLNFFTNKDFSDNKVLKFDVVISWNLIDLIPIKSATLTILLGISIGYLSMYLMVILDLLSI